MPQATQGIVEDYGERPRNIGTFSNVLVGEEPVEHIVPVFRSPFWGQLGPRVGYKDDGFVTVDPLLWPK